MTSQSFETGHQDMIHDAQLDFFGKRLATCSSDSTIRVFQVTGQKNYNLLCELKGHNGPVWQVCWSHPKYGVFLASCSYDHHVFIWKETSQNIFQKVYEFAYKGSVNSICWAPHELGLTLASASSDGSVSIISYNERDQSWSISSFKTDDEGCNSVSWAPAVPSGSLSSVSNDTEKKTGRLATGGVDGKVKLWREGNDRKFVLDKELAEHNNWVRDVAWAPNIGLPFDTIASCSQDKQVIIWKNSQEKPNEWNKEQIQFETIVWRVSWNTTGNILAVSTADNKVTLFKEDVDGKFKKLSEMNSQ